MILRQIVGEEGHPAYQRLLAANLGRQYSFLVSAIASALEVGHRALSEDIIKALHFHAVACLDSPAGSYRTGGVRVGDYVPPSHEEVPELMTHFVDTVNRSWGSVDPFSLSAYSLWQLNHIHPFVNGNGRTARALCYYIICTVLGVEAGMAGAFLPELIREKRGTYVDLLKECDEQQSQKPLRDFLVHLLMSSN